MSRKFVEVEHTGVKGTAHVPESALRLMPGWKRVTTKKAAAKKTAAKKTAAKKTAAPRTSPAPSAESKES